MAIIDWSTFLETTRLKYKICYRFCISAPPPARVLPLQFFSVFLNTVYTSYAWRNTHRLYKNTVLAPNQQTPELFFPPASSFIIPITFLFTPVWIPEGWLASNSLVSNHVSTSPAMSLQKSSVSISYINVSFVLFMWIATRFSSKMVQWS